MRYIFYVLIFTILIYNPLLHGSKGERVVRGGLKILSMFGQKPANYKKVTNPINAVFTGETPISGVPSSESMPTKKPTAREIVTTKLPEPPEKKVTLPKETTVTRQREFTAVHQLGREVTKNSFKMKNLENDTERKFNSVEKIATEQGDKEGIKNAVDAVITNQDIIKGISEITEKTPEEIEQALEEIQKQIQKTVPESKIAKELTDLTVATIKNNALLKEAVTQNINFQIPVAGQAIFALLKKIPQQIVEEKAPFEIVTIPPTSFETTLDLISNPEKRAKNANVSFEADQATQDIIVQASGEGNVSPVDFTIQSMREILSGNDSPEANAIINKDGYVAITLTKESIDKLEAIVGPRIGEIFAKDSEFIDLNQETNNLDTIIVTNNKGDAIIIADGLKPVETLPESSNKLIQDIIEIETKKALLDIPSLSEQLNKAFSKKHDPVLDAAKKEILESESEKLLPGPEEIPREEFPTAEIKQAQQGIATKTELTPTPEPGIKTVTTESPGAKKLPAPEQTPKLEPRAGEPKKAFEQISEPKAQEPTQAEKPKTLAETVKGKAEQLRETKPLEGEAKTPISPTPLLTTSPETLMIGAGKEPLFISTGAKPIETGVETLPLEITGKTGVAPQQFQISPLETELTRVEREAQRATTPFESPATRITAPELKMPFGEPLQPKGPLATLEGTGGPKVISEVREKRLSAPDSQIESFVHESSKVIENFGDISDVFLEKTNLDLQSLEPQVGKNINEFINQAIETSQSQLKEGQTTLHQALNESKSQETTEIINSKIQSTVSQTQNMLNRTNATIKTDLDRIVDPAVKQLAKDAVDLITRAAQQSLSSMNVLARISAELTNVNNGNFKNTTELTQRLQELKIELETEIKEQQKQANELTQMHIREKRTKQGAAKKSTLLQTILKALVGIIAAIAIEEFDAKQIAELSQQITDAQALIDATEKPIEISEPKGAKKARQRFLPLANQSTQLKNRTISAALQTPEQLKTLAPMSYEIPPEITPEAEFVPEQQEEPSLPFFNASRDTIAFHNEQDSKLLGEQLHQIEKKVEKKLEKSEKRANRARKKTEEQTISGYKNMYTSSDTKSPVSQEEPAPTPTMSDTGTPYTPSYGYEPSFDHSFDMFDFSGLSTDFEHFDLGYFGDLDFLSEFGFEDWESFGREYPATPPTTPKTTGEQYPEKTAMQPEALYPGTPLPYGQERGETMDQGEKISLEGAEMQEPAQEQETLASRVIQTPYTQYLVPALAIITIGCALLFYWFM